MSLSKHVPVEAFGDAKGWTVGNSRRLREGAGSSGGAKQIRAGGNRILTIMSRSL